METNYELKHKCLLVPLKAILLVLAMVLVGFTTYAQQGKAVKVATDEQLIEAMDNPAIGTIELSPGFYAYLNIQAEEGTFVVKQKNGNGGRSSTGCTYSILAFPRCYNPSDVYIDPDGGVHNGYSFGSAEARVDNSTCLVPPCCPLDGSGRWTCQSKPAGAAWPIFYDTTLYSMPFYVNKPGTYLFRYTWDPLINPTLVEYAFVETEYNFYGPDTLELTSSDVCGLTTLYDFTINGPANLTFPTLWTLQGPLPYCEGYPVPDPVEFDGPDVSGQYPLTV